jgi:hypothetical protein
MVIMLQDVSIMRTYAYIWFNNVIMLVEDNNVIIVPIDDSVM